MAAASLAASRAELVALAEASPLYLACDWYREWLGELRQDGTLTRLATQGDAGLSGQGVHLLEFLDGRTGGRWADRSACAGRADHRGHEGAQSRDGDWARSSCGRSRSGLA